MLSRSGSKAPTFRVLALAAITIVAGVVSGCAPAPVADEADSPTDAFAARTLARKNHCLRCHGVTKPKEGPTYAEVAAKYRANPNAEARLYEHLTSGWATMPDGHLEEHKIVRAKTPEQIRNLVHWILDQ